MIRTGKLNDLLDKATDQALKRIEKKPDEFSNTELVQFIQAAQGAIERSSVQVKEAVSTQVPVTLIQNNINVNVGDDTLNNDERGRVLDIMQQILESQRKQTEIVVEAEEKTS